MNSILLPLVYYVLAHLHYLLPTNESCRRVLTFLDGINAHEWHNLGRGVDPYSYNTT